MIIKNLLGVFKYAKKSAQNGPMTITIKKDGFEIVVPTSAFKKNGELRVAAIRKLKAAGINW